MEKIINLKFADTESDTELYNWISKHINIEDYLKGIVLRDMMDEKNKKGSQITSEELNKTFDDDSFWD